MYRACKDASYFAAMLAVQGILAALRARDLTGTGQRVDTNMLQAITCRQNPQVRWLLRDGEELPPDGAKAKAVPDAVNPLAHHRDPRDVTPIGMMVECKDGRWIMHSLSEPHFFPAWIEVLGFDWIWEDERFKGAPHQFADDDTKDELVALLQQRMKEKTAAEWMELYVANGNVCADVVQTTQDALRHPQFVEGGFLVELDDPRVGRILQVGPLAKIPSGAASVRGTGTEPRQHTDEILQAEVTPLTLPTPSRATLAGPLDGITIVEAAYYYATPFATALLAELGARVIKIEPVYGDPYRLLARATGDPVGNVGHNNMVRAMQGKESIALEPQGRARAGDPAPAGGRRGRLRAQLPPRRARVARHRLRDAASDQPEPRLPVRSVVRLGRPVLAAARDRSRDRRVLRPDRLPDRRGQPAAPRERRRPGRGGRTRRSDDARPVRAAPHR